MFLKKPPGIQSITGRAGARSPIILYQAESTLSNLLLFWILSISVNRVKQQQQIKIWQWKPPCSEVTSIQNQQIQTFVKFLIEFFIKKDQDSFYKRSKIMIYEDIFNR